MFGCLKVTCDLFKLLVRTFFGFSDHFSDFSIYTGKSNFLWGKILTKYNAHVYISWCQMSNECQYQYLYFISHFSVTFQLLSRWSSSGFPSWYIDLPWLLQMIWHPQVCSILLSSILAGLSRWSSSWFPCRNIHFLCLLQLVWDLEMSSVVFSPIFFLSLCRSIIIILSTRHVGVELGF